MGAYSNSTYSADTEDLEPGWRVELDHFDNGVRCYDVLNPDGDDIGCFYKEGDAVEYCNWKNSQR